MYGHIVLADTKSGFVPSAIKFMTNSQFSHSFVTVPNVLNTPMCIEASSSGVDFTRFDTTYLDSPVEGYQVWQLNIDQSIKDAAIVSLLADLESSYGYLQFFWFIWRKLNSLVGRNIQAQNNWFNEGFICSQLCVAYIEACGLSSTLAGYGVGAIAPQDLQNIFIAHPEAFTLIQTVRLP